MKLTDKTDCFLLDMDGTVYLGGRLISGAAEAVERMRAASRVLFLTNNTSVSRKDYARKLTAMGIKAETADIFTAGNAAISYLAANEAGSKIFLLGTDSLKTEFSEGGITLTEDKPDAVVVGFDTSLTYQKLSLCCKYLREGSRFYATHPDLNCPVADGYIPDVGSFLALIEASTRRRPEVIFGKPFRTMGGEIERLTGLKGKRVCMVGDRLSTDMKFALSNGFYSALVLSGEADRQTLAESGLKVDAVLDSIAEIE